MLLRSFERFHNRNDGVGSLERASMIFSLIQGWGNIPFFHQTDEEQTLMTHELILHGVDNYDKDENRLNSMLRTQLEYTKESDGLNTFSHRSFDDLLYKDSSKSLVDYLDDGGNLATVNIKSVGTLSHQTSTETQLWRALVSEEEEIMDEFLNSGENRVIFEFLFLNNPSEFITLMEGDFTDLISQKDRKGTVTDATLRRYFNNSNFIETMRELYKRVYKFDVVLNYYYEKYRSVLKRLAKLDKGLGWMNTVISKYTSNKIVLKDDELLMANKSLRVFGVDYREFLDDFYELIFSDNPLIKNKVSLEVEGQTFYRLLDNTLVGDSKTNLDELVLTQFRNYIKRTVGEGTEYLGSTDDFDLYLVNKKGLRVPKYFDLEFVDVTLSYTVTKVEVK